MTGHTRVIPPPIGKLAAWLWWPRIAYELAQMEGWKAECLVRNGESK